MTIRRILIANRGEIAVRIMETCQRLGIETILGASEADLESVPARLADRVVTLGGARADQSYLNVSAVVAAAVDCGADAIHPGYGFLAENAALARACGKAGVIFIGATAEQLEAVGDKLKARELAASTGLPVVPGVAIDNPDDGLRLAREIGEPVIIKAVAGGGGRGMTRVDSASGMKQAVEMAMAEAKAAFGDGRVYLERFVEHGQHIEVQLLGDGKDVIHLGERNCSIQRRYQKLVEEAPAPGLDDDLRREIYAAAVALGGELHYRGLGTVEFLVDCRRREFYFLEVNARIQVEHPVTEMITGLDLVAEQIAVAEGQPLRLSQDEVRLAGHAVECRINAEDWRRDFRPSPGTISRAVFPVGPGIRVDTHVEAGASVPPYYDSLIAKIIVHGGDRPAALDGMRTALANCRIDGIETNVAMHARLMEESEFNGGAVDTTYFPRFMEGVSHG